MTALWILAGIVGGAVAGLVDTGVAIAGGIGGMTVVKALRLAALSAGLVASAGGLAGLVLAAGDALARRTRRPAYTAGALWTLAFAPLVIYDAFALFSGPRAARIPAHAAISIAVVVIGLAAIALAAVAFVRLGSRAPRALSIALGLAGIGAAAANRFLFPRLYGWFHVTLSVATMALFVLAARLRAREGRRPLVIVSAAVAAVAGCAFALVEVRTSQVMRYVAHERTALAALVLRGVPVPMQSAPNAHVASERRAAEVALPPLPAGPRRHDADVLLITIDALRVDHVGAFGYRRPTTPNIDALATGGTRFTHAYAQAPHTSFSVASMLTGKYFPTLARLAPGERHEPLAAVLRKVGWRTAAFYPPAVFYIDAKKTEDFAKTNFDFEYVKFEYIDANKRVDQVLAYYADVQPPRSFVWIHFFEPHEPYDRHEGFAFGSSDIDRYDSEIAYTDAAVGRLIAAARKRRPDTIVVVAADHGEEFDEHGGRYHGTTLYDEQLRVPLIISIPGIPAHVVDGPVEMLDVAPTLLNMLDVPVPVRMRGTDLGPWLAAPPAPSSRLPPAFAEVEDKRMVVAGTDKLLCDLHWGTCAFYDLATDPHEQRNLAETRPDRAAALRTILDDWLDGHVRFEPLLAKGAADSKGGLLPKAIERGRLGDLLAGPELAAIMTSDAPAAQRREAAQLLVALPARPETAAALARAAADPDREIADWAAVGAARLGDKAARPRVQAIVADTGAESNLRVRAALALAAVGDAGGVPVLGDALDRCDDALLCRSIIASLGKLRDRRAVPVLIKHLPAVRIRRQIVEALGDIGDPAAADVLLERLRGDEYVPVRIAAAKALAKLGDARLAAQLDDAARKEKEAPVVAAARAAATSLRGKTN
ncbi:MAG TPA: sulfatase-like hydrolase/transferase [Polyangia bacterium]|nr:sulfatase-like hydrolase/transferase [Polyangia bacterium]